MLPSPKRSHTTSAPIASRYAFRFRMTTVADPVEYTSSAGSAVADLVGWTPSAGDPLPILEQVIYSTPEELVSVRTRIGVLARRGVLRPAVTPCHSFFAATAAVFFSGARLGSCCIAGPSDMAARPHRMPHWCWTVCVA